MTHSEDSNPQDLAVSTSTQSRQMAGPTTTVRQQANGRCVVTIPKPVARGLAIDDRESDARDVCLRVRCVPAGIALDATVGRLDDACGYGVRTASVKRGSVQLTLGRFQALAWGLVGCELVWPDPDDVESVTAGPQSFPVGVREWESSVDASDLDWQWSASMHSTGTGSGADGVTVVPVAAARAVGLADGGAVRVAFGCDGGPVARLSVVDRDEAGSGDRLTVSKPEGVIDPRIVSRGLPGAFGVVEQVRDGRVGVEWAEEGGALYARVVE